MSEENFDWDDESQDSIETGVDSVIAEQRRHTSIGAEAMRRIEQAKLYESLLSHDLFAVGSGSPEIIEQVESEIKTFITERLEVLLGMRSGAITSASQVQPLPFSEEQVRALQALANRVLKTEAPQQPTEPSVVPFQKNTQSAAPPPARVNHVKPNTPASRTAVPQKQSKRGKRRTENVSQKTNQDYSQSVSQTTKPVPPPTPDQQNMMAVMSASNRRMVQSGEDRVDSASANGILNQGIQVATRMNAHIREDNNE